MRLAVHGRGLRDLKISNHACIQRGNDQGKLTCTLETLSQVKALAMGPPGSEVKLLLQTSRSSATSHNTTGCPPKGIFDPGVNPGADSGLAEVVRRRFHLPASVLQVLKTKHVSLAGSVKTAPKAQTRSAADLQSPQSPVRAQQLAAVTTPGLPDACLSACTTVSSSGPSTRLEVRSDVTVNDVLLAQCACALAATAPRAELREIVDSEQHARIVVLADRRGRGVSTSAFGNFVAELGLRVPFQLLMGGDVAMVARGDDRDYRDDDCINAIVVR